MARLRPSVRWAADFTAAASATSSGSSLRGGLSVSRGRRTPCSRVLRILKVASRIRAVERLVAEGEVGDDIALDRRFEQWPLEPRSVAQMTAGDRAVGVQPHVSEDVAAERLDQSKALARAGGDRERDPDRPLGQAREHGVD